MLRLMDKFALKCAILVIYDGLGQNVSYQVLEDISVDLTNTCADGCSSTADDDHWRYNYLFYIQYGD